MKRLCTLLLLFLLFSTSLFAQVRPGSEATKPPPTITEKIAGMEKFPGYFPFYWDAKAGKIFLQIDRWNTEFLYVESLPAGGGQTDLAVAGGRLVSKYVDRFEHTGPRVLQQASNY